MLFLSLIPDHRIWIVIVALLIVGIVWTIVMRRRRRSIWQRFANRHGFQCDTESPKPLIVGIAGNRRFELRTDDRGSDTGELGVEELAMAVTLNHELPAGLLAVQKDGLAGMVSRMVEADVIDSGSEAFDHRMIVHGRNPDAIRGYLTEDRRQALLGLAEQAGSATVTLSDGRLYLNDRERISSLPKLEERLQLLLTTADKLDGRKA